jgi:hypothetical protein
MAKWQNDKFHQLQVKKYGKLTDNKLSKWQVDEIVADSTAS